MKSKSVRSAVETCAIVLFIFLVLACRCQSDLLKLAKKSSTPEPTPYTVNTNSAPLTGYSTPTPPPLSNLDTANSVVGNRPSIGTYTGSGINTTYNQRGDFLIRIDSVDDKGGVRGYFEASNGLTGNGALVGGVDNNGKMGLFGKMTDGKGLIISATSANDAIRGSYVIGNKESGIQKGEFTVYRK